MNLIEEENILAHKEFNLYKENDLYNLRIEIANEYIYFTLKKLNIIFFNVLHKKYQSLKFGLLKIVF